MTRELNETEASGMTVSERLFVAGLIGDFDKAVAKGDVAELQRILRSVYVDPDTTEAIIEQVLR